jgi:hypothetical protein
MARREESEPSQSSPGAGSFGDPVERLVMQLITAPKENWLYHTVFFSGLFLTATW